MDFSLLIGILGMFFILLAFLLNQIDVWNVSDVRYDFVNLVGSSLALYYAYTLNSLPFMVINGVWTFISLKDVLKYLIQKK